MTSIGETLRRERQKRNLGLEQISRELKISSRLLEAIEEEKFDKLPGGVFARSFIRQYARLLGLDEEEVAGELQRHLEPGPDVPVLEGIAKNAKPAKAARFPESEIHVPPVEAWEAVGARRSWSSWLPALAGVVGVVLLCSVVYAWWQHEHRPGQPRQAAALPQTVQAAPPPAAVAQPPAPAPESAPPAATPETPAGQPATPPASAPDAAAPAAAAPAAGAPDAAEKSAADQPAAATSAVPSALAAPRVEPLPNAAVRVELTAQQPVWVRVERDGKYLYSGVIDANQSRILDGNESVRVRVGNASSVSLSLNGKPIGAVGKIGQPLTLQFTSGGFEIISAAKPAPTEPL